VGEASAIVTASGFSMAGAQAALTNPASPPTIHHTKAWEGQVPSGQRQEKSWGNRRFRHRKRGGQNRNSGHTSTDSTHGHG
jgi:hypothetical protein